MKNTKNLEKFIELRSQGLSFDKISKEIGVSKPTLIKWNQEYADEVANQLYFNTENLLEQYKLLKMFRVEALARTYTQALDELSKRNFEKIPTQDLISMIFTIKNKLKSELASIRLQTGEIECTKSV